MRNLADFVAERARAIDASGIRKVFDLAARMKDPINLSIGLPDFDVPDPIKQAACDAIWKGHNAYTPTQGIEPLRRKIRQKLDTEIENLEERKWDVIITGGVAGGLVLSILALVNPGDEVVFLDPYFVMYRQVTRLAGGTPVMVDSYPSFRFDASEVERRVTPGAKLLVLGSPANPTGAVMSEEEVRAAVELARRHDLIIISDEIYDQFVYDDRPLSPARLYERTILLRGFSKTYAMTGWRLGWAAGPAELMNQLAKLQQYTFTCAPAPFQHAAVTALDTSVASYVEAYRRKRQIVMETMGEVFGIVQPGGAFYAFCQVPPRLGITASQFVERAIENNVLVIPGGVFSNRDTHFRLSYACGDEKLRRGCEILARLAR